MIKKILFIILIAINSGIKLKCCQKKINISKKIIKNKEYIIKLTNNEKYKNNNKISEIASKLQEHKIKKFKINNKTISQKLDHLDIETTKSENLQLFSYENNTCFINAAIISMVYDFSFQNFLNQKIKIFSKKNKIFEFNVSVILITLIKISQGKIFSTKKNYTFLKKLLATMIMEDYIWENRMGDAMELIGNIKTKLISNLTPTNEEELKKKIKEENSNQQIQIIVQFYNENEKYNPEENEKIKNFLKTNKNIKEKIFSLTEQHSFFEKQINNKDLPPQLEIDINDEISKYTIELISSSNINTETFLLDCQKFSKEVNKPLSQTILQEISVFILEIKNEKLQIIKKKAQPKVEICCFQTGGHYWNVLHEEGKKYKINGKNRKLLKEEKNSYISYGVLYTIEEVGEEFFQEFQFQQESILELTQNIFLTSLPTQKREQT